MFGTPGISKSTACPVVCCDLLYDPMASFNSNDLNPLDGENGIP